jgi:recombination protein RecA
MEIDSIVKSLKKQYSTISKASDIPVDQDFIDTDIAALNLILDGGLPFGYAVEFLGLSSSGKSLLIQQMIAKGQQQYDAIGVLLDREHAFFPKRGEQLGIDNNKLIVASPSDIPSVVDGFQFLINVISSIRSKDKNAYIVAGIDSLASFAKDVTLDKSDSGRRAKSVHEGMRALLPLLDTKVVLLVANQVTYKIGVMYGDPKTTTAGESMKYYCTIRIALEDRHKIIDPTSGEVIGNWIGIESIKTRLGPSFRTVYVPHYYKTGIPRLGGYARLLVDRGYLFPKNKSEFQKFAQSTVLYINGEDKEQYSEHSIEKCLEKHPELKFDSYPEFNRTGKEKVVDEEEEVENEG